MKDVIREYYEAWVAGDRGRVRELLHDELVFTSPQDRFESASSFLTACWAYSSGLAGVRFVKEVYERDRAFVVLQWLNEDGTTFGDAEYLELAGAKIKEILVVNNDPRFEGLIR